MRGVFFMAWPGQAGGFLAENTFFSRPLQTVQGVVILITDEEIVPGYFH
jgi:hypothetical protein